MSGNLYEFNDANFEQQVLHSDVPVLVDFWAEWCGPCRAVGPTVDALSAAYSGEARVGKLNIDENSKTAQAFGIKSIPTVLVFNAGQVVKTLVGVKTLQQYKQAVDQVLAAAA